MILSTNRRELAALVATPAHARQTDAAQPNCNTVILTPEELAEIVKDAVARALDETRTQAAELVSRATLAAKLDVSISTVARLHRLGIPHVRVCDSIRYRLVDVIKWLGDPKDAVK